jgi:hypothetical protein
MSIVIIGAGPNLGMAIARRFGREGLAVGLISRNQQKLDGLVAELTDTGITAAAVAADIRDLAALTAAIQALARQLGPVEILEYSPLPAGEFMKPILETTAEDLRGPLEVSGEVAYAGMLHKALANEGIHVAHTAIHEPSDRASNSSPTPVADILWHHHTTRQGFQTRLGIE